MCRIVPAILISLFCFGPTVNSAAQTRRIDSPEVLKQLMALAAPTPRHAATPAAVERVKIHPVNFFAKDNPPPDDAPVEDLTAYWIHWSARGDQDHVPTDAVRQRLFDQCLSTPAILPTVLNLLPATDKTVTKVKELYDKEQADPRHEQLWRERVKRWLLFNSTYFLDELIGLASKAKDGKEGDVLREDALAGLAKVSWTDAERLLRAAIASGQPRTAALAISLFYKHAVDEKDTSSEERYRRDLQAIAANRTQPGYARNKAIEALALSEWSGRDDWYIGLFQDETLLDPSDGEYSLEPLTTLVSSKPDKWIPIMAQLVEGKDLNLRSAAAYSLVLLLNKEPRKDAIMPLLPWLTNPAWAHDRGNRAGLIRQLGNVDVPESVPGLIWVLDNDDSVQPFGRSYAAEALARYKDPRSVPALKRALAREKDEGHRQRIIKGLVSCQGLTEQEQVEALEQLATKFMTPEGRQDVWRYRPSNEEPLPVAISIGKFLSTQREAPESLIMAVLARAEQLKPENPGLAKSLTDMIYVWQGREVEADIIRRIADGSADSSLISQALFRKPNMQEELRVELQGLASVAGAAQGVGAVLLNDPALAQEILTSEDQPAQIALLACARLTQTPLPVELVSRFLRHKNSMLAAASEAYLLAEDSREARELLLQRYPNQAFVTGWREDLGSSLNGYGSLIKHEETLRAEVLKEDGPTEILAYVHNQPDKSMVLRIYRDKAVFTEQEDAARHRERTVSTAEVSALKDYLTTTGFPERGPTFNWCHHGCPVSELLVLTKEKGRRVLNHGGMDDWMQLQKQFDELASGEGTKIRYKLESEIKGLEVLYAGELTVNAVAQQGGELRIFVERPETKEETEEIEATYNSDDDEDDENAEIQGSRRRVELKNARFSWRIFSNDKVGAVTTQPDFYSTFDESRFMVGEEDDFELNEGISGQTQVLTADSIVIARYSNGLWRQVAGAKPVRLGTEEAAYMNPIVTRDGKWVIATKSDAEWEEPGYIVRVNLQTGREFRLNIPPADQFSPLAYLPSHGKVLLRRAKAEDATAAKPATGPASPEFYLLDPSTGITRLVLGDFKVFQQAGNRFLQSTDKPDEFWAAIPDDKKNQTEIGRYSLKDFSFKPMMVVPQINFDSMAMWVDAAQAKVYVAYKGQLLRLPLQTPAK